LGLGRYQDIAHLNSISFTVFMLNISAQNCSRILKQHCRKQAKAALMSSITAEQPQLSFDQESRTIIILPPKSVEHTGTIVGPIHGLGDSAHAWLDGALHLWQAVPYCKMILPDAPVAPVTMNNGFEMPSWYDIQGLSDRFNEDCKGISDSRARISKLIEDEISSNIPAERIVVAGFSQGGALSLFTGLQFGTKLGGCLVMSGYLAGAPSFNLAQEAKDTPVLHLHGIADPMVKIEWARETKRRIAEDFNHSCYELKEYEGLGHSVSNEEMTDAREFLKTVLPEI
jgi:lysophospholipase II